jgi:hypothetical protein
VIVDVINMAASVQLLQAHSIASASIAHKAVR